MIEGFKNNLTNEFREDYDVLEGDFGAPTLLEPQIVDTGVFDEKILLEPVEA